MVIASASATLSAIKIPFSCKNKGKIKVRGISKIIFLSSARSSEILLLPSAKKLFWHPICTPIKVNPIKKMGISFSQVLIRFTSLLKMLINGFGKNIIIITKTKLKAKQNKINFLLASFALAVSRAP